MSRYLVIGLMALIGLSSCSRMKFTPAQETTTTAQEVSKSGPFKGLFTLGDDVRSIKLAPGGELLWVEDGTGELEKAYRDLASLAYEPIYVEVEGRIVPAPQEGFAADYKRMLVVERVTAAEHAGRNLGVFPVEFTCKGQEPFWSLTIIKNDLALLKDLSSDGVYYLKYAEPKIEGEARTYVLQYDADWTREPVRVEIKHETCHDPMSGEEFNYSARMVFRGKVYRGCAEKAGEQRGPAESENQ